MPLGPRLDHRQRDPLALVIDSHHPDVHHVADAHHVVRALHITIGKLANVHQTRILETNIDKRSEVNHIENRPLQLHARAQIFNLQDTLLEDGLGQIVARVALGTPVRRDRRVPAFRAARVAGPFRAPLQERNRASPAA
jgi:hypothetical protein